MLTKRKTLPKRGEQRSPDLHKRAAQKENIDYVFDSETAPPGLALVYEVTSVYVPPEQRCRGIGAKLVRTECHQADKQGYWLILQCYPWEVMEESFNEYSEGSTNDKWDAAVERLKSFYARFGFIHSYDGWMYRKPRKR